MMQVAAKSRSVSIFFPIPITGKKKKSQVAPWSMWFFLQHATCNMQHFCCQLQEKSHIANSTLNEIELPDKTDITPSGSSDNLFTRTIIYTRNNEVIMIDFKVPFILHFSRQKEKNKKMLDGTDDDFRKKRRKMQRGERVRRWIKI